MHEKKRKRWYTDLYIICRKECNILEPIDLAIKIVSIVESRQMDKTGNNNYSLYSIVVV